jgi:hypothetical protein
MGITNTTHFDLVLPDDDELLDQAVINGNMTTLDTLARAVTCTSGTRPSTTFAGQVIFETDTNLLLMRNNADSAWSAVASLVPHVTSATRPGSPAANQMIYETDTRNLVIRNAANNAWENSGIPTVSSTAQIPTTYNGQLVYDTSVAGLKRHNGSVWALWDPNTTWISKSANETVTNSTSIQNDNDFAFTVASGAFYTLEGYLVVDGAVGGDLKMDFTLPAGATMHWTNFGNNTGGVTQYNIATQAASVARAVSGNGGTASASLQPKGYVNIGGTAGTLQFRWAQNTLSGTASTIYASSWMKLTRIA